MRFVMAETGPEAAADFSLLAGGSGQGFRELLVGSQNPESGGLLHPPNGWLLRLAVGA